MKRPLIGVCASRQTNRTGRVFISVSETYLQALSRAGASPVVIPLGLSEEALDRLVENLDGILFTGGGDIAGERYGQDTHPKIAEVDPDRDRVEFYLLERAIQLQQPFFGICRGFQLVNVGLGGGLYADIPEQHPGALKHDYYPDWPRDYLAHPVKVLEGSRLSSILPESIVEVNSLHHQGVGMGQLAPRLNAVAWAPDELVEATEMPGYPFGLCVQWHPEELGAYPAMRALFEAFVTAARGDKG